MRRSDWLKVLGALGFTALGLVCGAFAGGGAAAHDDPEAEQPAAAEDDHLHLSDVALANLGVVSGPVAPARFQRTRSIAAVVVAPPEAERPLFAPIGGRVRAIEVHAGRFVRAGETVVELVREPIPPPALELTADLLAPASEERHQAVVALRRATGELRISRTELERVREFTMSSDEGLPIVPRDREIQLRYAVDRAEMELARATHELERHGLTDEQIEAVAAGGPLPPFDGATWQRALAHNGLWPAAAAELAAALPAAARDEPWVVATVAELAARDLATPALVAWLGRRPEAAPHFVEIGVLRLRGYTVEDVDRLLAAGALAPVVRVAAPHEARDWRVDRVAVRAGAHVAAGEPLAMLHDERRLWLQVEPVGDDVADLSAALVEQRRCRAVPLLAGDGVELDVTLDYLDHDAGRTIGIATLENRPLTTSEEGRFRTWALRPGQRYTLHVPTTSIDDVVVLPIGALATDGAARIVYVRDGVHIDPLEVRVLERDAEHVVVPSEGPGSIAPGTIVVQQGALALQLALSEGEGGDDHHHH